MSTHTPKRMETFVVIQIIIKVNTEQMFNNMILMNNFRLLKKRQSNKLIKERTKLSPNTIFAKILFNKNIDPIPESEYGVG